MSSYEWFGSGYYIRNATDPALSRNFLFVLEGGGMCTGHDDCRQRAGTDLGSSKRWKDTFDWSSTSLTTPDAGNHFRGWNTIWLKYCDGGLHTGQRTVATNETFGLYFAGHLIVSALLDDVAASHGLNSTSGSMVVFAGGSAGGLGVFANVESVASRLPHAR